MEVISYNVYKINLPEGNTLTFSGLSQNIAELIDSAINPKGLEPLFKHYQVDNVLDLVRSQEAHIKKFQEKVEAPSFILKLIERVRAG